ncbi:PadR family transcriptional regulator [Oceanibacterium hippocampi]|uniref:Transcriptional regulator PadR-like family protein n=1 Tax=Oceanibacterium hippocampi TaxID=745714 RepID=A0A1Y5U4N2_9PROT|nr:PadR family transcriptional regulator [Oceanibacterium hippocampi]SLN76878.1 Transcriptional regulator PadR-like family protein [Oceanibacterium hippocampi]
MDIRMLCLGLLTLKEATGYEIKKTFEGPLSHFYEASYGSIYPALNKLTEEGLLTCDQQAQDKRPDKKVYSVTSAGKLAFMDALQKHPGRDRIRSEFLAVMMFARLLPAGHLSRLIDDRIDEYRDRIAHIDRECAGVMAGEVETFICGYGKAVYSAAVQYLEDNRHLLESEALMGSTRAAE